MVLTVFTNKIKRIKKYKKNGAEAFIFDLKDFSTNDSSITVKDIEKLLKREKDIEVFVNLNKMIFNKDIHKLKDILVELSKIDIKGVLFYDLAILEIVRENNIEIELVWNNTHMVTNYNTCNYFYDKGVNFAILSSEITLEEMIEIKNKSKITPFVQVLGYPIMAHSKRKLLSNYFQYNSGEYDNKTHSIKHEDTYLIKENETGTTILNGRILNGSVPLKELMAHSFPYVILNDDEIEEKLFIKILAAFISLIQKYDQKALKKIEKLIGNDTGFFYKKTIYKVK